LLLDKTQQNGFFSQIEFDTIVLIYENNLLHKHFLLVKTGCGKTIDVRCRLERFIFPSMNKMKQILFCF
jgi:Fe2+ or Zn2+ uptake regulation protein